MSDCPGWKYACGLPAVYRVSWSWDGARNYPSEHDLCGSCATACEEWVAFTEQAYLTDARFEWRPLMESERDTRGHNSQDASPLQPS